MCAEGKNGDVIKSVVVVCLLVLVLAGAALGLSAMAQHSFSQPSQLVHDNPKVVGGRI
jgi:hypothetical protein